MSRPPKFSSAMALLGALLMFAGILCAQEQGQKSYPNAQDASKALYEAVKSGDKAQMQAVLGASSSGVISSGDEVQDKKNADFFTQHYEQMNRWGKDVDGSQVLYIGAENWPFPIPLKNNAGAWYFDSAAGAKEILFRRIGKNELAAINVCRALADAQDEYFSQKQHYAEKILSDPGQQNGLYWKVAAGESPSPIGPLVADATSEGYGGQDARSQPFHGYYYRTLAQPAASKTAGFAFIAWPAEYRNSGVMTFLIGKDGVVYQKDLGPKTADLAKAMKTYSHDKTWKAVPPDMEDEEGADDEQ